MKNLRKNIKNSINTSNTRVYKNIENLRRAAKKEEK